MGDEELSLSVGSASVAVSVASDECVIFSIIVLLLRLIVGPRLEPRDEQTERHGRRQTHAEGHSSNDTHCTRNRATRGAEYNKKRTTRGMSNCCQ